MSAASPPASPAPLAPEDVIIVGNSSDDPFAIDVAFTVGQAEDIADLISMKNFANTCLLYTSPSPRDLSTSRMPSSA